VRDPTTLTTRNRAARRAAASKKAPPVAISIGRKPTWTFPNGGLPPKRVEDAFASWSEIDDMLTQGVTAPKCRRGAR
jgi:hypothetical protein